MQRITALCPEEVPVESKSMLEAVAKKYGKLTNFVRTLSRSTAVLKFYLGQVEALSTGILSKKLCEQLALQTAGINGCDYCASAHTYFGKRVGLDNDEMSENLAGRSQDYKAMAALLFAKKVMSSAGHLSDADIMAVREAGYNEQEIIEIVAHVSLNIFANYFNSVAKTASDFPAVPANQASPV